MRSKFKWILMLFLALVVQIGFAQERIITGVVSEDGMPLPGATVIVKGTSKGVSTDFDGKYSIAAKTGDVLEFSYVGMKTKTATVGASNTVSVSLDADNTLDEVVVVAYGTSRKEALTSAVNQIDSKNFEGRGITNVLSAIEGVAPGLQMTSTGGQPGRSPDIRIRGFSSVTQSNEPLYVVDGVPGVSIQTVNMMDVESLSILKDAAATSLYGSRGANGVILITTKKGKKGSSKFSFNVNNGTTVRGIREYNRVNPGQFYETQWESIRNGILTQTPATPLATANQNATNTLVTVLGGYNAFNVPNNELVGTDGRLNPNAQLVYQSLDWNKEIERIGLRQQYDMSYSTGADKSDMFVSMSYINEEGYIQNTDTERILARINANFSPKDWFKYGLNLSGSHVIDNGANEGATSIANPIRMSRFMGSIYPVYMNDAQGNFILDADGNRQFDRGDSRGPGASAGRHAIAEHLWNVNRDRIVNVAGRAYATFKFLDHFKFTTNAGLDYRNINGIGYENPNIGDGVPGARARRDINNISRLNYNNLLEYNQSFKDFNVDVLLGQEYYHWNRHQITSLKEGQLVVDNTNLSNFNNILRLTGAEDNQKLISYLTRINLDYQRKYFLSLSGRQDDSSKFSPNERRGYFWSVGASWVLSNEKFLENNKFINLLKIRGSAGTTGNDGDALYGWQGLYDIAFNNTEGGAQIATVPPLFGLSWEKNFQTDVALEFGLFNRINATIEYYRRETQDLIFSVPLPVSAGVGSYLRNIGDMHNKGFEFDVNIKLIDKKDFGWNLNINATTVHNEITRMPDETPRIISGTKQYEVGRSINDFWLRSWYGVDSTNGNPLYIADDVNATGVFELNGTMVTPFQANAKFDYHGSAIPDLFGGIRSGWRYKNFNLDVLLVYSIGGKIYDSNYATLMHSGNREGQAWHVDILNRWQQPGDASDIPRVDRINTVNIDAASSRWLTDASYLSIRSASFSYNLNNSFAKRIGLSNMRFFVTGENLWLFSARQGMDPQQNFFGTVSNVYIPARMFSWGLNVSF